MSHIIEDGKGRRYKAEVDSTKKLQVRSISESSSIEALDNGDQYFLHSAVMNIDDANESYFAFMENLDSTKSIIITDIEISFYESQATGPVVNTDQNCVLRVRRNPTGPSFSTTWFTNNADFGSPNTLNANSVTGGFGSGGGSGGTLTTNGSLILHDLIDCSKIDHKRIVFDQLKLRPGNSIAFSWTPPSGNIDQDIHINLVCYLKE